VRVPEINRRSVGLALAALLFLGLVAVLLRPRPVRVDVARAVRGMLQVTVDEEGRTRVRDRFVIAAPISGRVARIGLDPGDAVDIGTVVARMHPLPIDPRTHAELEARLEAAEAAQREAAARVEQSQAALEQAQRSANRARQLGGRGMISPEERELAELEEIARQKELEAALFGARGAAYNVEAARAALLAPGSATAQALVAACEAQEAGCLELRAPVRGSVLRVPEESERVVSVGTPLVELGDTAALEVVVDVLSADAVKVRPGARMLIEEWGGAGALEARVRVVEPSGFTKISALGVEEQRVNVIGDFVSSPVPLADNYRVEARIVVSEHDQVLKIPASAIFRREDEWHVFAVAQGRARERRVEVGERNTSEVEVVRGVTEGDVIIVHPSDQVRDGVRVVPL